MRIISGKFKGKKLLLPNNKITRPLKDMTKESIFNLLQHTKNIKVNLISLLMLILYLLIFGTIYRDALNIF